MSIFGSIMSAIFGSKASAKEAAAPAEAAKTGKTADATATTSTAAAAPVDVAAILDEMTRKSKTKGLDWRKSIVDLMKLLDMDSGLKARQQLAKELKYSGDTSKSAEMNVWLHKHVMKKLAENGGKLPKDLL